jgi:hypothetical protein
MPALFRSIAFAAAAVIGSGVAHAGNCNSARTESTAAPGGAITLSFCDFYQMPIGAKGLQPTDQLQRLRGQTVRIVGYMVHEENPTPGLFMLASQPVSLADIEDGPADDLPATMITAHMPEADAQQILPYRPGLWELTGKLDIDNREERNGRVSFVRLLLDKSPSTKPAQ